MPTVSVIIPAYNSAGFISRSIESALNQREVSLEVIVVDDGSTDRTREVLTSYGDALRCVHQKNQGAYVARNKAAALANGEWLAFLDADDRWAEDKLIKQLQLAEDGVNLIYSDCANLDDSGRVDRRASEVVELPEGRIFDRLLTLNFITTSTVLIRRSVFEELGGFTTELQGCADWDLWLRYAASDREVRVHPEALTTYHWHDTQMSKNFEARQRDRLQVIRRAVRFARESGRAVPRSLEREAYGRSWATAAWFVAPSDHWQACKWCFRALFWQPFERRHYKLLLKSMLGRT